MEHEYTGYVAWDKNGFKEMELIDVVARNTKLAHDAIVERLRDEYEDGWVLEAIEDETSRIVWRSMD